MALQKVFFLLCQIVNALRLIALLKAPDATCSTKSRVASLAIAGGRTRLSRSTALTYPLICTESLLISIFNGFSSFHIIFGYKNTAIVKAVNLSIVTCKCYRYNHLWQEIELVMIFINIRTAYIFYRVHSPFVQINIINLVHIWGNLNCHHKFAVYVV